jgi:hypothetical protein
MSLQLASALWRETSWPGSDCTSFEISIVRKSAVWLSCQSGLRFVERVVAKLLIDPQSRTIIGAGNWAGSVMPTGALGLCYTANGHKGTFYSSRIDTDKHAF